ncbi:hypothetical protein QBC35DRAFT_471023 [Podospora australis]|uniref:Uncharacterized protein n=1 Tax=Podospora australis TaxID=1536484 RepID=A0AAN6WZN7_9PEZI|nr:hypothetical protein QBC35DRAFT_471023 [Podospora australis]
MTQLHLPPRFHPFPHQQQLQQRFLSSKGQSGKGHLGDSGEEEEDAGSSTNDGGASHTLTRVYVVVRDGIGTVDDVGLEMLARQAPGCSPNPTTLWFEGFQGLDDKIVVLWEEDSSKVLAGARPMCLLRRFQVGFGSLHDVDGPLPG